MVLGAFKLLAVKSEIMNKLRKFHAKFVKNLCVVKKHIFSLLILFFSIVLNAQEVVSTQGDSFYNGTGSIDFTLGEVIISTETDGTNTITQGFHLGVVDFATEHEVVIFPNPASDWVFIRFKAFENVTYTLYNAQGKLVKQDILTATQTPIQISQLAPGAYLLHLKNNIENLQTIKIAILH